MRTDGKTLTVYDGSSNTAYGCAARARSGHRRHGDRGTSDVGGDREVRGSKKLGSYADTSEATPGAIAGQAAYTLRLAPKHYGGLLGAAEVGWDAVKGVPLRAAIYAQGDSSPVLELTATDITYGAVSSADVEISPPANATVVNLSPPSKLGDNGAGTPVTGAAAVAAAVPFTRKRLTRSSDSRARKCA